MHTKGSKVIEKILILVVVILGLISSLYLLYYNLRYSYAMDLKYNQETFEYGDLIWLHVLSLVLFCFVVLVVCRSCVKREYIGSHKRRNGSLIVFAGIMFLISLLWIFGIKNSPANDQGWVLDMISELEKGNYDVLLPHGYLGAVQFQIGLATVFWFIFKLFNNFNYQIIQVVNASCVFWLVIFNGWYIRKLTSKSYVETVYKVLAIACIPLYVYSAFVYGEMISITVGMVMVWLVYQYIQTDRMILIIPIGVCAVLGTMTRGNYWVLIISISIMLGWYAVSRKKWKYGILLVSIILLPILQKEIMISSYEYKAGFEMEAGMSKELWIAMGMQENGDVANGWYNGYNFKTYNEVGQDSEAASQLAKAYIRDRSEMFKNGAADWKTFYKEKFLSQWNEPTYECFSATDRVITGKTPLAESIYSGTIHWYIEEFLNQYQLIIYAGFLLYIVFSYLKKAPFLNYLIPIYVIGGMLFSALWEASSRYVFPYFVFMIPCAAYGWTSLCTMFLEKKDRIIRKSKRAN